MAVNCYLVVDDSTKEACLIDPGAGLCEIKNYITKNGFKLKFIINTHGHGDHIAGNGFFDCPIYIHKLDKDFLKNADLNLSSSFFFKVTSPEASRLLEDGDRIKLGDLTFRVLHTPGHTPGSISLKLGDVLFSGDTLFCGAVGRTDFDYGDEEALYRSMHEKLLALPDDTTIYPGHGDSSTIGREKKENPFLI
jgi:glyoxylase-like metal-dependent hydrolase (beta-lactamase superfamily II)